MDTITRLCSLLEEEKQRFLEYEEATLALLDCETDAAENYITQRGTLANEIDALIEEMARLCDAEPAGEVLLAAAKGSIDFARVPAEFHCVFYAGQAVRSVIHRITQTEKQAMERLEALREEALSHIRQNQNLPKIKKYLTDLGSGQDEISLTSGKA